jgi:hypothetical protein
MKLKRSTLWLMAITMAVCGSLLLLTSKHTPDNATRAKRLGEMQGIVIRYDNPSNFYIPPFLPEDAHIPTVEMKAVRPEAVEHALYGIENALKKYPPGFMDKLIKAIFICGDMTIAGASAGGTYGPAWVLLAAPVGIGPDGIRLTCRMGVHHELSSFVYLRGDNAARWRKMEPKDWRFSTTPDTQIQRDKATPPNPATGFLSSYGATTPENDFNVYAEKMMTELPAVMRLSKLHPIVAKKAAFVRECYMAIDPRMGAVLAEP